MGKKNAEDEHINKPKDKQVSRQASEQEVKADKGSGEADRQAD